jgi:osmotically-inducible protein OsmY
VGVADDLIQISAPIVGAIMLAARCPMATLAKEAQMQDDLRIRDDILDELEDEPGLDASAIGVTVHNGVATLTGHVKTFSEKRAAEKVAARIKGVRAIVQEIAVETPREHAESDDVIADRAVRMLEWDVRVPHDRIQINVEKGWVTLSGQVDWRFQKEAAEKALRSLASLADVTNLITVTPRMQIADVQQRIERALKRHAELEAAGIRVSASGGNVVLEGKVHNWFDRKLAEDAAWRVPGVVRVEDRIAIEP